jgi:hypothetical protein
MHITVESARVWENRISSFVLPALCLVSSISLLSAEGLGDAGNGIGSSIPVGPSADWSTVLVSEPVTLLTMGIGLLALAVVFRHRNRK